MNDQLIFVDYRNRGTRHVRSETLAVFDFPKFLARPLIPGSDKVINVVAAIENYFVARDNRGNRIASVGFR